MFLQVDFLRQAVELCSALSHAADFCFQRRKSGID